MSSSNDMQGLEQAYSKLKQNDYSEKAMTITAQKRIEYKRRRQVRKVTGKRDMSNLPEWMQGN